MTVGVAGNRGRDAALGEHLKYTPVQDNRADAGEFLPSIHTLFSTIKAKAMIETRIALMAVDDIHGVVNVERHRRWRDGVAGAKEIAMTLIRRMRSRNEGAFSQREAAGCEHRSVPVSGSRPQARLNVGSLRNRSRSSASSQPQAIAKIRARRISGSDG